jgi:hypothetical protein
MTASNYQVRLRVGLVITVILLSAVVVLAQVKDKFAQAQRENAQAMRQYTWKSRTEVRKNGETKNVQLALMRYDIDGSIQKTPMGGTQAQTPDKPMRGIRGRVVEKKKEEFKELMENLGELVKSYSHLTPEKMQSFLASAAITPGVGGVVQILGRNVLHTGDSMTVWVDPATQKQRKVEIQAFCDKYPVRAVSDFRDLPDGPTYLARSVVDYPKEELQLITENFDYERQVR